MAPVDILIPTINRLPALVMTLTGVATQSLASLRLIVSDQSDEPAGDHPVIQNLRRVIAARGGEVEWHQRPQVHGIAEQRDFLLGRATADTVLYLDDDVLMEPWVVEMLLLTLREEGCAFVGAFPAGLTFRDDVRPDQQRIELWDGRVRPEEIEPEGPGWERWNLHRAANLWQVAQGLPPGVTLRYKVAWISTCVIYDRARLLEVGGFGFWRRLPRWHAGEEVLVQNLLMRRWGGCGIVPAGTYHAQMDTTVLNEAGRVDGHALDLLPEMVARYAPGMPR